MIIKRFEDLDVYQDALALQRSIFALTKGYPKEERYALTDQIRRSSRSIGANIAEGWHKRRYPAHFALKLTDADAESAETRHWLVRERWRRLSVSVVGCPSAFGRCCRLSVVRGA